MEKSIYQISLRKQLLFLLKGVLLVSILGYLFYESIWGIVILVPFIFLIYTREKRAEQKRQMLVFNKQFLDALTGITSALSVGYSLENSMSEALKELRCVYSEEDLIVKEFQKIVQQVQLNRAVEQVFYDFAIRSGIEDILNFAWILYTVKRTGGDLLKVARATSQNIRDKIEVSQEIQTVVTSKRLESNIMNLVPAGIIAYLKVGCKGFLDPLYHNRAGVFVMTAVLVGYFVAYIVSCKLVQIKV